MILYEICAYSSKIYLSTKEINQLTLHLLFSMCIMFQNKLFTIMIYTFDSIGAHSSMSSATASKDLSIVIKTISNE